MNAKLKHPIYLLVSSLVLSVSQAQAQTSQVQAALSVDGRLFVISGTQQDDVLDLRLSCSATGPDGGADLYSNGAVIFHFTPNQRQAVKECRVSLFGGNDRFLVHDSPTQPFNANVVWKVNAGDGDDVVALNGPAVGSTTTMVEQWLALRAPVVAKGEAIVNQSVNVMSLRLAWAEARITDLLIGKSAAVQTRALAQIERLVSDNPTSLVSELGQKMKSISAEIAAHGPDALMARKGITEKGLPIAPGGPDGTNAKGISEKGLPYEGVGPLFNADPVIRQIALQEARMISLFDWLPDAADDGGAAELDQNDRLTQSLAFAQDISLAMETLGANTAADIAAAVDPVVAEMTAISDGFSAESIALGTTLENTAVTDFLPIEARITGGPLGTDSFEAAMAVYQADAEAVEATGASETDAAVLGIIASLTELENLLSPALQTMDAPDTAVGGGGVGGGAGAGGGAAGAAPPPPGGPSALTLPGCNITTTNTISGGAGFDLLIGTPANDNISGNGGVDFIFGRGGDDIISGDADVDFLFGMKGGDDISGGDDTDFIFGDAIFWSGNDCLHGNDGIDVILGEKGDDAMEGGDKLDLMIGGAGNDIMNGDKGNDIMLGWTGNDSLDGGDDTDLMLGDYPLAPPGDDLLAGSGGTTVTIAGVGYEIGDIQFGNDGTDTVNGGSGIDFQWGNLGDDTMNGDDNMDLMFGGPGQDVMEGELGGTLLIVSGVPVRFGNVMFGGDDNDQETGGGDFDIIFGNKEDDRLIGGKNSSFHPLGIDTDLIFGGPGNDYADGHHRTDLIFGQDGDDELHGDLGALIQVNSHDIIFGGDGDDQIFGGNGNDLCFGNKGADTINGEWDLVLDILFGNDGNDVVDGDTGNDLVFGNDGDDTLLGGNGLLDIIFGNSGNDVISGQGGIDLAFGNTGNDVINGDGLSDILFGNEGDDTVNGGDFPDLIFGNDGCDVLSGNNSADIIFGNAGDDNIHGNDGIDFLFGNTGNDTMSGDDGIDTMFGNEDQDIMSGGNGFDLVFGNDGNDEIHGDNGPDILFGNDGNDCLSGDNDPDMIFGGQGSDNIHGGSHLDTLFGNEGDDCIFGENGIDLIFGGDGNDDIYGGDGSDAIWGNSGDDSIRSEGSSDAVNGGDGDDDINAGDATDVLIFGNDGNDRMHGANGNDWMFGNGGNDRMWGNDGNDKLWGNSGDDVLDGGNGNDYLAGGSGNDSLYGGPGTDVLIGGTGSDSKDGSGSTPEDGQREAACGRICGKKWNDLNRNGLWDGGEPGLPGVRIYLDLNNNNAWNAGEPFVFTSGDNPATCADETGCYCFYNLRPGNYIVREVIPAGFIITFPANNTHQFYLNPGEKRDGVNFGNARPQQCFFTVRGCKFLDKNGNGIRDPFEMMLPGVTIFHDQNNNGILDAGEPFTVTGPDGCYALNFPYNGTVYITHICEVVPGGMAPTFPQGGCKEIDIFGCGEAPFHVDFGNRPLQRPAGNPDQTGLVFLDQNGDGIRQATEPGMPGLPVWRDTNGNGLQDADEPSILTSTDSSDTPEDESGTITDPAPTARGPLLLAKPLTHVHGDPHVDQKDGKVRTTVSPVITILAQEDDASGNADNRQIGLMIDSDGDGSPDIVEARDGTQPNNPDSDGDSLTDGNEAQIGTNPLLADTDKDQLNDGTECDLGTDPTDADSDDDGLSDGFEIAHGTSPFHGDSDLDGLSDLTEKAAGGSVGNWRDFDRDGLSDQREIALGTNPNSADTDGDGESDASEALGGTDPLLALDNARSAGTQPRNGRIAEFQPDANGQLRLVVLKSQASRQLTLRHSANLQQWTEETLIVPAGSSTTLLAPMDGARGYYQVALPAADAP